MKEILETTKVNVNGNKIAVCLLQNDSFENLQESNELRAYLVNQHKDQVDTVMAVSKLNDIAVKTVIFEPNSGDQFGNFSNMCGNGLRAVHQVTKSNIFITPAGTFFATTIENKDYICTRECRDIKHLQEVAITDEYIKSLKRSVKNILNKDVLEVHLCGNFEGDSFNGEPHFVILLEDSLDQKTLINLAKEKGYELSYLFSDEIQVNVTFVSSYFTEGATSTSRLLSRNTKISNQTFACTFERNLGSNPEIAVTGSCGTGAMAAANTLKRFFDRPNGEFILNFPKDVQKILIQNNQTYILINNTYENF